MQGVTTDFPPFQSFFQRFAKQHIASIPTGPLSKSLHNPSDTVLANYSPSLRHTGTFEINDLAINVDDDGQGNTNKYDLYWAKRELDKASPVPNENWNVPMHPETDVVVIQNEGDIGDYIKYNFLRRAICAALYLICRARGLSTLDWNGLQYPPTMPQWLLLSRNTNHGDAGQPDLELKTFLNHVFKSLFGVEVKPGAAGDKPIEHLGDFSAAEWREGFYGSLKGRQNIQVVDWIMASVEPERGAKKLCLQLWGEMVSREFDHGMLATENSFILSHVPDGSGKINFSRLYPWRSSPIPGAVPDHLAIEDERADTMCTLSFFIFHAMYTRLVFDAEGAVTSVKEARTSVLVDEPGQPDDDDDRQHTPTPSQRETSEDRDSSYYPSGSESSSPRGKHYHHKVLGASLLDGWQTAPSILLRICIFGPFLTLVAILKALGDLHPLQNGFGAPHPPPPPLPNTLVVNFTPSRPHSYLYHFQGDTQRLPSIELDLGTRLAVPHNNTMVAKARLANHRLSTPPLLVVAKIADEEHSVKALRNEFELYTRLEKLQGRAVPVCYGFFERGPNWAILLLERCGTPCTSLHELKPQQKSKLRDTVEELHRLYGIQHNDLEPRNVVVSTSDDQDVRVIDFGQSELHPCPGKSCSELKRFKAALMMK